MNLFKPTATQFNPATCHVTLRVCNSTLNIPGSDLRAVCVLGADELLPDQTGKKRYRITAPGGMQPSLALPTHGRPPT